MPDISAFVLDEPLEGGDSLEVLLDTNDSDDSGFLSWISAPFRLSLFYWNRIFHVQDRYVDMSICSSSSGFLMNLSKEAFSQSSF